MTSARYRSLDLLRALAIALVITGHTVTAYGSPPLLAPLRLGGTGVDLFFVLSGWLLGSQLIRELTRTDHIDLRRFWLRRWMRTLPAYYAVLAFTFLQQALTHPENKLQLGYLFFIQNYSDLPYFSVSWSLCVEEYFYLCVAPAMLLLARLRSPYRWVLIGLLFFAPLTFRMLGWYTTYEETHVRWDGCMLGVLLAVCRVRAPRAWETLTRAAPVLASVGLTLYLANFVGRWWPNLGIHDYDKLVYALIFGSFVLLLVRDQFWREKIYVTGASYIAIRAYSLYLLHPEVLALMKRFGLKLPFPIFYLTTWIASCLLAEVLYRALEKPIMDWRDRISATRSASGIDGSPVPTPGAGEQAA
jgi:peptidoglycan/LPS O-acetylase OafA/YrhL